MIRRLAGAALLALASLLPLAAQEGGTAPEAPLPPETFETPASPYRRGDHVIGLSAGLQLPLALLPDEVDDSEAELKAGGVFGFNYQYFLGEGLAIGGSLSGAFNGTVASRSLFVAPLSFRTAYWWSLLPFEFYAAGDLGAYLMRFDGQGMLGPFLKLGGAALWQTGSGWSVGLQASYWLVPELHSGEYSDLTRWGHFLETGLVAVYHL